ncbi:hypothetical protein IVB32_01865, partial [Bradyrhizobium sp. 23]|nr:hypothetical protein [Bradyrhizobium sp. 23]
EVLKSTGRRQEPFVYGSLGGDTVALVPPVAPPIDPNAGARRDYELAAQAGTKQAWLSFLAVHATGIYANFAHAALDKLEAAEKISENADAVQRQAEQQVRQKSDDFRKQIEEQAARETERATQQISEQARRDLEKERQRIAEQAKRELDDARRQVAEARRQAEDAALQVEQAMKQAALEAQQQIEAAKREADRREKERQATLAALTPPAAPAAALAVAPTSVPAMDPADIARLLQAHLKRVGCDPGAADGAWTAPSQKALDSFNRYAGTKFDVKVASLDALDAVRARPDRICPLVCARGQKAVGDRCVQIVCDNKFVLDAQGVCQRRPDPSPQKPKAVSRHEPSPRAPSAPASSEGGKCHTYGGKQYCQ